MGSCLSTVLPRSMLNALRKGDLNGSIPLPDESDSTRLPGKVNGKHTPVDVTSKHAPKGVQGKHVSDDAHNSVPDNAHKQHLSDDVHDETDDASKRRALLVGITYCSPSNTWSKLDGPHGDVDQYRALLINTYGYRPKDIVVLKDLPEYPKQLKPTRVNMLRELNALVAGAKAGDKFTFFYSGHSDQQDATSDMDEEDGLDEMIITSDEQTIVDNDLKKILVNPLPVGCTLLAILDTCHSGTMLDLPHYHCNTIYVPWQSKGERRTMTMQNINVRAMDVMEEEQPDTQPGEASPVDQREISPVSPVSPVSPRGRPRGRREIRDQMLFGPQIRFSSPEARFICDGWCKPSDEPHANVLSLSACSDLQRAWEGPKGSLTTVLCNYLKECSRPSYGDLMTHVNFELHDNALALHEYTRHERKLATGFDGELDNFQEPELSSLVKLNMDDILELS